MLLFEKTCLIFLLKLNYRPSKVALSDLDKLIFCNELIIKVKQTNAEACYILGDININLLNGCKYTPIDNLFVDNCVPLRRTRIDSKVNSYTLIDNTDR